MHNSSCTVKETARKILESGQAERLLGWEQDSSGYNHAPAVFKSAGELDRFIYDRFCGSNLSKLLARLREAEGRTAVLLKACDRESFNLLVREHRIDPEQVHRVDIECSGMVDIEKLRNKGIKGIREITESGDELHISTLYGEKRCRSEEVLLEKCLSCPAVSSADAFDAVGQMEERSSLERYEFWKEALSTCIRCNACRNSCPVCTCEQCIFDNPRSGTAGKASADFFEDQHFHLVRVFHAAGRCTDCGECTRVCPQGIPLYLLNRKVIKDINELYGELSLEDKELGKGALTSFSFQDAHPDIIRKRTGDQ